MLPRSRIQSIFIDMEDAHAEQTRNGGRAMEKNGGDEPPEFSSQDFGREDFPSSQDGDLQQFSEAEFGVQKLEEEHTGADQNEQPGEGADTITGELREEFAPIKDLFPRRFLFPPLALLQFARGPREALKLRVARMVEEIGEQALGAFDLLLFLHPERPAVILVVLRLVLDALGVKEIAERRGAAFALKMSDEAHLGLAFDRIQSIARELFAHGRTGDPQPAGGAGLIAAGHADGLG